MNIQPWKELLDSAEHVRRSHQPDDDDGQPARRDVQLVMSSCYVCRMMLESAQSDNEPQAPDDTKEAMGAIDGLLQSFVPVLQGVGVETLRLAKQCKKAADDEERSSEDLRALLREISSELHSLVAPGSEDCA